MFLTFRLFNSNLKIVGLDNHHSWQEVDMLHKDLSSLKKEREDLLIQIREFQTRLYLSDDFEVFVPFSLCVIARLVFLDSF